MRKNCIIIAAIMLLAACQESLEEKAAKEAKTYTQKNCPAKIGDNLLIDSLTYEADTRTLHYYYTLTGPVDTAALVKNSSAARNDILRDLKNTTTMKAYKDEGFNFAYTYRTKNDPDKVLLDFKFTKKDY